MDIEVLFPGGKRVDARVGMYLVQTDQPAELGGEGAAPAPFDLFLASMATCAGIYALSFCQARQLSIEGLRLHQHVEFNPTTHLPSAVQLRVTLPPDFPEKYRLPLLRSMEGCKVKKTLAAPPTVEVMLTP